MWHQSVLRSLTVESGCVMLPALQIVDLGCGRGSLAGSCIECRHDLYLFRLVKNVGKVGELRAWGHLAVGLDANPLLTATLNEYGMAAG